MYDDFRQKDGERVTPGNDLKVVDVEGLGTAAYLYRQHDDSKPWTPGELWLYKYIVRHGPLLLTVNATGTARERGDWPTVEQEMRDKVKKNAEETMKALRA
ncbi:hypothetical protein [Amycolatopsis regifaucium]|uniref:Uncharacterized protein n=1 Tax=Amycolatopsis regifaucium TaxID=546365 RepID=A0A154MP80_9PSEU|nr:hypothetical protein [Amycolatopsis regifaucium]KZB86118.1 hypothetical protein AVL48_28455 [Amycolatopsis regifaucium]OKA05011.1 hypothetical protein ATP06_0228535 [Amycolatopsis regifaucium]SFH78751.1 hypothetical protein SAMN04489731_106267 [Amycolatopsis regifaucium]